MPCISYAGSPIASGRCCEHMRSTVRSQMSTPAVRECNDDPLMHMVYQAYSDEDYAENHQAVDLDIDFDTSGGEISFEHPPPSANPGDSPGQISTELSVLDVSNQDLLGTKPVNQTLESLSDLGLLRLRASAKPGLPYEPADAPSSELKFVFYRANITWRILMRVNVQDMLEHAKAAELKVSLLKNCNYSPLTSGSRSSLCWRSVTSRACSQQLLRASSI